MAEQNGGDWDNDDGHFGSMVDNDDEELAYKYAVHPRIITIHR